MKIPTLVLAGFVFVGMCQSLHAQTAGDEVGSERVDAIVREQMHEKKIPGVSLGVIRDGKIVKATGYGLANVELNVPVTPQSAFHTESVGKTFTAVGVMILVEEGKVGLDDRREVELLQCRLRNSRCGDSPHPRAST